jgi:type IV secretion system protein VirB4
MFAARIREWLKTLRKKNVAVVFATQSLADVERSSIAPALIESCPTRIFLPNDRALEPQARAVYERFGLNARQIEILGVATPKRDYYAQTARGNRIFELGLGPVALALTAASSPDDQRLIDRCFGEGKTTSFAARFLDAKGLGWASPLLERWPQPATRSAPLQSSTAINLAVGSSSAPASSPRAITIPSPQAAPSADQPRNDHVADTGVADTRVAGACAGDTRVEDARGHAPVEDAPVKDARDQDALVKAAPLPGLPGGPPMSERLSPYRLTPRKFRRRVP